MLSRVLIHVHCSFVLEFCMVTEECVLFILSLQSTKRQLNQTDSNTFSQSEDKRIAWSEHTSVSHSKNKSLSQSKSKSFSQLKSKDFRSEKMITQAESDSLVKHQTINSAQSEQHMSLPQPESVTFSHGDKIPAKSGNKNAFQHEYNLNRLGNKNITQPEKSSIHAGKKNISQMKNKSLSLSSVGDGSDARHNFMLQVY